MLRWAEGGLRVRMRYYYHTLDVAHFQSQQQRLAVKREPVQRVMNT